eukprot:5281717-Heterocapsa_arctica.AAC.1
MKSKVFKPNMGLRDTLKYFTLKLKCVTRVMITIRTRPTVRGVKDTDSEPIALIELPLTPGEQPTYLSAP